MEFRIDQKTAQPAICSRRLAPSGDREGLSKIFGSQRQRLFYAALRLLGNNEDAEDAVQEGLLAALRNLDRFEGRAQLSTWLTRIVMNAALMQLRSRNSHEWEPIDESITQLGDVRLSDLLVDGRPNPEEVCARTEQHRIMNQGTERPEPVPEARSVVARFSGHDQQSSRPCFRTMRRYGEITGSPRSPAVVTTRQEDSTSSCFSESRRA